MEPELRLLLGHSINVQTTLFKLNLNVGNQLRELFNLWNDTENNRESTDLCLTLSLRASNCNKIVVIRTVCGFHMSNVGG